MVFKSRLLGELKEAKRLSGIRRNYMPLKVYQSRADLARKKGDFSKALEVYKEALRKYPEDPSLLNHVAWFLLTEKRLKKEERDLSLALALARKAVRLDGGGDWDSLDTLALALFENGKKAEAAAVQERAVGLQPGHQALLERLDRYRKAFSGGK